jgi:phosphate transport system substrate-binding protein
MMAGSMLLKVMWRVVLALAAGLFIARGGPLPGIVAQEGGDHEALKANFPVVSALNDSYPVIYQVICYLYDFQCLWSPDRDGFHRLEVGLRPDEFRDENRHNELLSILNRLGGSGGRWQAYSDLARGYWDLIIITSPPPQDAIDEAASQGVTFDLQPVALDALAMAVHDANPLSMLTLDQVRALYTHQITTWTELGVRDPIADDPANTVQFPPEWGDVYYPLPMERLVLPQAELDVNTYPWTYSEQGVFTTLRDISSNPQGIGYTGYYNATYVEPRTHVKLLGIDGVYPTRDTIADRSYPLTYEVYVVIRAGMPPNSPAVLLRDWLLTPEGQTIVAQSGMIPLTADSSQ